ncbi:unnamed protein product [Adineta ricciae]|uniref:Amine oxidase n=1 Tax=Adineta ricciae TaxID=249248 RepID=A0A815KTL3_ADIRI|nr:unnamed protein product [Adineta ricciae]CAF1400087.1 unnamed protein product [Adineta ricciae]
MEYAQVIIVGGGISGLAAAKTLGHAVKYVLIEAQDYLGGRVLTVDAAPDLAVDMGAQYVLGDKSALYKICDELKMLLDDDDADDDEAVVVTTDGKTINSELMDKATDFWERSIDDAEDKSDGQQSGLAVSFADFVPKVFQRRLLSCSLFPRELFGPITDYFMKSEMTDANCISLSDLNLIEYSNYEDPPGEYENDLKYTGYRPLVNYLKSFIPNDQRIRLNCEVVRVKFLSTERKLSVEIHDSQKQQKKTMICDHIIWTTSLGYLKEHFHRIFADEHDLLRQKQNAITNIGFGVLNKVILIYKKKFWRQSANSIILLHTQENHLFEMSDTLRQLLSNGSIDPSVVQEVAHGLSYCDVLPCTDIPVLVCWFGGPAAITIENFTEQFIGQICHETICSYLKIDQDRYPPVRVLKSGWHNNKYTRGSYSYHSVRSSKQDGKQLRIPYAPDGIQRILFAGEATHEQYYASVNAAFETGTQAAKKILSIIN